MLQLKTPLLLWTPDRFDLGSNNSY